MKIAIVKLSALGDIIQSAFVIQFIKQKLPQAQIDWIVQEEFADILKNVDGINCVKTINLKGVKKNIFKIHKERKKIKSFGEYDLIIDLQGLLKSAIVSKFLGKNVAGFDRFSAREGLAAFFYKKRYYLPYEMHTADRYRQLVSMALDIEITKEEVLEKSAYMIANKSVEGFKSNQKKALFVIGSTWESRCYPKEKFVQLAQSFEGEVFIPFGNDKEYNNAKFIEQNTTNVTVLPKLSLCQLRSVVSKVNLVVGNDTGPTYIGWANNIPTVIIFGSTPADKVYESKICKLIKSSSSVDPLNLNKEDYSIAKIDSQIVIEAMNEVMKYKG